MLPWEVPWLNRTLWKLVERALPDLAGATYGLLAGLARAGKPVRIEAALHAVMRAGLGERLARDVLAVLARTGLITVEGAFVQLTPVGLALAEICAAWTEGGTDVPRPPELLERLRRDAHAADAQGASGA